MRFANEAWPFVLPFVALAGLLAWLGQVPAAIGSAVASVLLLLFFRVPQRRVDASDRVVLAPGDGRVTQVDVIEDPAVGPGRFRRVVTFLSVFNVHVQNVPATGRVIASAPTAGRKVAAFVADADKVNASHLTVLETAAGDRIAVRQIVGLVARRIVCDLAAGDTAMRGDRLGLIKFGSRVDLLVPESYDILVAKGDRVRNGATHMATAPER